MGEELPHYLPIPLALVWITSIFIKQLSSVSLKCNNFIDWLIAFQTKEGHVCKDWSQLHYLTDMNFFISNFLIVSYKYISIYSTHSYLDSLKNESLFTQQFSSLALN